jgi:predicted small secreted protein
MMMMLSRLVPSLLLLLSSTSSIVSAQNAAEDALRDMQIGMQGLQAAASDPAMMAQLMADLQVRNLPIFLSFVPVLRDDR